eukprot:CAMPEP_0172488342 /NCGR_PEP_ID=MMETSP1066-20121228/17832_1 /TAXON_ID=671091 /ORGANISM="Coscinodiscus wailesii, Strain CCMP2513" /LENGTH=206 /DNA_ID=CAMNT_0013255511 /DNA_START=12 /DNA_END=632 /DNA_ORIENTATION=+
MWIRPGSFHDLPMELNASPRGVFETPVLYIGAGTGIAPLRGMIREREFVRRRYRRRRRRGLNEDRLGSGDDEKERDDDDDDGGYCDQILLFGCRKQTEDYLYHTEWKSMLNDVNNSFKLLTAFSQDQNYKIYVQTVLSRDDNAVFLAKHVLERGGAVYIAGGKKMAKAVREEIVEVLGRFLDGGENQAKLILKRWQRRGLFRVEAW